MRFKRITRMGIAVYVLSVNSYSQSNDWYVMLGATNQIAPFDASTITYATAEGKSKILDVFVGSAYAEVVPGFVSTESEHSSALEVVASALANGLNVGIYDKRRAYSAIVHASGTYAPYMSVTYDEATTIDTLTVSNLSPSGGSIDKTKSKWFSWRATAPDVCYPALTQQSAVFQWRTGTSGTIRSISVSGNTQSVTVPANTFTGASIQWRVVVTANSGVATTSDWITLSTADATSTAAPISPKGEVRDRESPIEFSWRHIISSGTAQTKADLQISADASTWTALATVTGSATTYTVPANTLSSGTQYWRVRTYNADGTAGEWSDAAAFICIGAPAAPPVSVLSQSPRPRISWQSEEQLAYQIEIVGVWSSGTYYGTDKQWTAPLYLEDGNYVVRVRVQNAYALWSDWGSAALQIANASAASIALTAAISLGAGSVTLSWTPTAAFDAYLVYRNDELIAKTTALTYVDSAAIGVVTYRVRGIYNDSGNYALSPYVEAIVNVRHVTLYDLDTGNILALPYADSAHRTTTRNLSRDVHTVQMSGRKYLMLELSDHYASSITVSCAFKDQEDCDALEALCGHVVIVKTPEGKMVQGCLSSLTARTDGGFYTVYQFTVDQMDTQEVVDIDA